MSYDESEPIVDTSQQAVAGFVRPYTHVLCLGPLVIVKQGKSI